jgi:hypothetical protein
MNLYARLGATAYVLWGLLHIDSARGVYLSARALEPGIIQGRLYQHAWNLLFFALFAIVVGLTLNWKNNRLGYWLNLVMLSAVDLGFIVAVLIPGYLALIPGGLGPALWILALVLSTVGYLRSPANATAA